MEKGKSFSISSIIRSSKNSEDDEASVYLRVTCDGQRAEASVHLVVQRSRWLSAKGRVKGNSEDVRRLNQSIETFEYRAREIYNKCILAGKRVTAAGIKNELLGLSTPLHFLGQEFEKFVSEIECKMGNGYAPGTVKNWKVTLGHLRQFVREIYGVADLPLKDLELAFLHHLELYASTKWLCGNNAIMKHIGRIRKVVNRGIAFGWLEKDPFTSYEGKNEKTHRTFLTQAELDKIEGKEIGLERLSRVRDIFLFSCYTGLAYVDVEKLTPDYIAMGIDNKRWIYTHREKTGNKSNIPLLPQAAALLDKYAGESQRSGKLLPVITNIKTNAYLKEIADICGIKKNLTFHMARHTLSGTTARPARLRPPLPAEATAPSNINGIIGP